MTLQELLKSGYPEHPVYEIIFSNMRRVHVLKHPTNSNYSIIVSGTMVKVLFNDSKSSQFSITEQEAAHIAKDNALYAIKTLNEVYFTTLQNMENE